MKEFNIVKSIRQIGIGGILVGSIVINSSIQAAQLKMKDIENHWAKSNIEIWVKKGLVSGYSDGTFKPEKDIARAEFFAWVNRSFGFEERKSIGLKDVKENSWYKEEVEKAFAQGYIVKEKNNTIRPEVAITREEVASILFKILEAKKIEIPESFIDFKDIKSVSKEELKAINAVVALKYMQGYPDGKFYPKKQITRAEALTTLNRVITGLNIEVKIKEPAEKEPVKEKEVKFTSNIQNKQQFYDSLKYILSNFENKVELTIENYNKSDYNIDIIHKIVLENPDINYGLKRWESSVKGVEGSKKVSMTLTFQYSLSKEEMLRQKKEVEKKVDEILAKVIKKDMKDYEKELAIHDYVIQNAKYDPRYNRGVYIPESHNPYGVLVKGIGVCESYAKSMYILLNKIGIETLYVIGDADKEPHAWNIVKIGGQYYHLDATWDDPTSTDEKDTLRHSYFNITDEMIFKTHKIDTSIRSYPKCNNKTYSYENIGGVELDSKRNPFVVVEDYETFYSHLKNLMDNRRNDISFKLKNKDKVDYGEKDDFESAIVKISQSRYDVKWEYVITEHPFDPSIEYIEFHFTY